ncbi:MAG: response regulator [Deltaproteobacteria bacterium]|nr:response regulator [Deltaproteobacteria bacterium]
MSVLVDATGTSRLLLDLLFIVRELIDSEGVALLLGPSESTQPLLSSSESSAVDVHSENVPSCLSSTTFSWARLPWPGTEFLQDALRDEGLLHANISQVNGWEEICTQTSARSALLVAQPIFDDMVVVVIGSHSEENHFNQEHVSRLQMLMPVLQQALLRQETERLREETVALASLQRESEWRLARVERALGAVGTGVATILDTLSVGEASDTFTTLAEEFGGTSEWGKTLINEFREELWHPFYERVSKDLFFDDKEGKKRCIEVHIVDGDDACFLLVKDVTETREAAAALSASEKVKDAILRSSLDAMISMDSFGMILDFNPSAERIFGYLRDEVLDKNVIELFVPKDQQPEYNQNLQDYLKVSKEGQIGLRVEVPGVHKDGRVFPAEMSVSETQVNGRRIFTAFLRDISDRKRAEKALESARDDALAADQAKSDLLAIISHEVRTPLNAALGLTELALDAELRPQTRSLLETAVQNARSLSGLLDELLDYAREEASSLSLQNTSFNLANLLAEVVRTFALDAAEKNIDLRLYLEFKLPWEVQGDSRRLRQVLMNLMSNAIKYTPKSEEAGQVIIEARSQVDKVGVRSFYIYVSDSGPGIDEEYRAEIFRRFERGSQKHLPGSGLGLPISRALAERMGGTLSLENPDEGGSRFVLKLPLRASSAHGEEHLSCSIALFADDLDDQRYLKLELECLGASVQVVSDVQKLSHVDTQCIFVSQRRANLKVPPLSIDRGIHLLPFSLMHEEAKDSFIKLPLWVSPMTVVESLREKAVVTSKEAKGSLGIRVLVVDDLRDNRRILLRHLQAIGCIPDEALGGYDAISKVNEERYDLVLMDVNMPDLDGRDATRAIRATSAGAEIPIVAVSAHALESVERDCFNAGMNDFVRKPITKDRLQELVFRFAIPREQRQERVLIVDDAPEQRLLLTHFLECEPYRVRNAGSAAEAIAALEQEPADVLLLDKELREESGLELLRNLQAKKIAPDVVILISGYPRNKLLAEATALGCSQVMQKPVSRPELLSTLSRLRRLPSFSDAKPIKKTALIEVDPDIADLVPDFLAARKKDASRLPELIQEGAFDVIRRIGHNLKGSARSYGFLQLGALGEKLETAAQAEGTVVVEKVAKDILERLEQVRFIAGRAPISVTQPLSLQDIQRTKEGH